MIDVSEQLMLSKKTNTITTFVKATSSYGSNNSIPSIYNDLVIPNIDSTQEYTTIYIEALDEPSTVLHTFEKMFVMKCPVIDGNNNEISCQQIQVKENDRIVNFSSGKDCILSAGTTLKITQKFYTNMLEALNSLDFVGIVSDKKYTLASDVLSGLVASYTSLPDNHPDYAIFYLIPNYQQTTLRNMTSGFGGNNTGFYRVGRGTAKMNWTDTYYDCVIESGEELTLYYFDDFTK